MGPCALAEMGPTFPLKQQNNRICIAPYHNVRFRIKFSLKVIIVLIATFQRYSTSEHGEKNVYYNEILIILLPPPS